MRARIAIALVSFTMAASCGSTRTSVRAAVASRAASDFACPRGELRIEDLDEPLYFASGCGQEQTYTCTFGSMYTPPTCHPEEP